jgi:negative regulator of genetic competence, sporulation and motility
VAQCFTPEVAKRVAELRAYPAVQARIEELAEKCNKGTITPEEMAEYGAYIQAMDVVAVLQKKARTLSVQPPAS